MKKNIFVCLISLAVLVFMGACSSEASEPSKTYFILSWDAPLATEGTFINDVNAGETATAAGGAKQILYTTDKGEAAVANPYEAGSIKAKIGSPVVFCMYPANEGTVTVNEINATDSYPTAEGTFPLIKAEIIPETDCTLTKTADYGSMIDRYGRMGYYWTVSITK